MEMTYKEKFRAEQLAKEKKHYEFRQKIREANKKTREVRALKLQQEKNQTSEEMEARKAHKLEQHKNYRQRYKQKEEMLKEQFNRSIPIKVVIVDSHQMTNNEMNKYV